MDQCEFHVFVEFHAVGQLSGSCKHPKVEKTTPTWQKSIPFTVILQLASMSCCNPCGKVSRAEPRDSTAIEKTSLNKKDKLEQTFVIQNVLTQVQMSETGSGIVLDSIAQFNHTLPGSPQ